MHENQLNLSLLIDAASSGDTEAAGALAQVLVAELRQQAARKLRNERNGVLQPTALVNEVMLRLLKPQQLNAISNRRMLYAAAARAMRQVLCEQGRKADAFNRLGRVTLDDVGKVAGPTPADSSGVVGLSEALDALEKRSARQFEAVQLRYFLDKRNSEVAQILDVSLSTVEKELKDAKDFLRRRLDAAR